MLEAMLSTFMALANMAHSGENDENWLEVKECSFGQASASQPHHSSLTGSHSRALLVIHSLLHWWGPLSQLLLWHVFSWRGPFRWVQPKRCDLAQGCRRRKGRTSHESPTLPKWGDVAGSGVPLTWAGSQFPGAWSYFKIPSEFYHECSVS